MKVALVFPPYNHKSFSENLKVVDQEFCHAPPLILAYIAAILRKEGHDVILIDAHILKYSKEDTLSAVRKFNPDILAFRLETYHFHDTLEWIKFLKDNLKIPVIAGGINLTLYPYETFSYREIDYGIIGDAIESLPNLLAGLGNPRDLKKIEGVIYREDGEIKINPPSQKIVDFNSYPFPARDLLPNDKYYSFLSKRKNFTIMVTSRGCPYKCLFCAIHKVPFQERSAQSVIDEIEECYHKYNIREIDFFDAIFFLNKKKVIEICDGLIKRKLKIEWSCRSRVDLIDEEILKAAADSGCRQILLGIESANEQVLKNINKGIETGQVRKAVALCNKYKILTLGFFMCGNPGDSRESIKKTINFAKELKLDFIQFCITIAKPNSDLNQMLIEKNGVDYWKEYILGKTADRRFPAFWTDLSERELEKYTQEAYLSFYLRPRHILRIILKIKSIEELMKYIYVAVKMIFCNSSFPEIRT